MQMLLLQLPRRSSEEEAQTTRLQSEESSEPEMKNDKNAIFRKLGYTSYETNLEDAAFFFLFFFVEP